MCNFLSALVTRTGQIFEACEYTDSHEDLVEYFNVLKDDGQSFVRVEFSPVDHAYGDGDLDKWKLKIDELDPPVWFDPEAQEKATAELRRRVERMFIDTDRRLLLGGCWILRNATIVRRVIGARIVAMLDGTQVDVLRENSQVGELRDNSKVGELWGNSKVDVLRDNSQVGVLRDNSKVENDKREK